MTEHTKTWTALHRERTRLEAIPVEQGQVPDAVMVAIASAIVWVAIGWAATR